MTTRMNNVPGCPDFAFWMVSSFTFRAISRISRKLFSSSAATGLVLDIFKTAGPDSYVGMITSILLSCTETLFYTMSVYYLAAKVTKTRYTIAGALWSTLVSLIMSVMLAGRFS